MDESDVVEVDIPGFVVVSQTCDIQRAAADRPFVTVCALLECHSRHRHKIQAKVDIRPPWDTWQIGRYAVRLPPTVTETSHTASVMAGFEPPLGCMLQTIPSFARSTSF